MHVKRRLALIGLVLGLALGGCGDGEADTPSVATDSSAGVQSTPPTSTTPPEPSSTEPSTPEPSATEPSTAVPADAPSCTKVWTDGAKLPRVYAGCVSGDEYFARDVLECSSGQRLVRFDESFYAVLGGTITAAQKSPLKKDADYRAVINACRA